MNNNPVNAGRLSISAGADEPPAVDVVPEKVWL